MSVDLRILVRSLADSPADPRSVNSPKTTAPTAPRLPQVGFTRPLLALAKGGKGNPWIAFGDEGSNFVREAGTDCAAEPRIRAPMRRAMSTGSCQTLLVGGQALAKG